MSVDGPHGSPRSWEGMGTHEGRCNRVLKSQSSDNWEAAMKNLPVPLPALHPSRMLWDVRLFEQ